MVNIYDSFMIKKIFLLCVILLLAACKQDKAYDDKAIVMISADSLVQAVVNEIKENYAGDVSKQQLEVGAIKGMLSSLDENSMYIAQSDYQTYYQVTRGLYFGLGIEIQDANSGIEVTSVIEDSPAFNAGIKACDIITTINDIDVISNRAQCNKILLECNKINLKILRNKEHEIQITVKKNIVNLKTVKLSFHEKIAIIKITHFNDNTVQNVIQAVDTIKKKGIHGIIIDLRGNPGGIIEQAVNVADLFLENAVIVHMRSRKQCENKTVFSHGNDIFDKGHIIVLIDKSTASGAELVAAALHDNNRAIIIGEQSYGKGSLQTIIQIPGKGAIKLTTAYLYTPNGNKLDKNGVIPNIIVGDCDNVMQRAIDLLQGIITVSHRNNDEAINLS